MIIWLSFVWISACVSLLRMSLVLDVNEPVVVNSLDIIKILDQ